MDFESFPNGKLSRLENIDRLTTRSISNKIWWPSCRIVFTVICHTSIRPTFNSSLLSGTNSARSLVSNRCSRRIIHCPQAVRNIKNISIHGVATSTLRLCELLPRRLNMSLDYWSITLYKDTQTNLFVGPLHLTVSELILIQREKRREREWTCMGGSS